MIESVLRLDPNGSWTIPKSSLSQHIVSSLKSCVEKCDRALALVDDIQVFKEGFINLRSRLEHVNQTALKEVSRSALAVLIIQVSVAVLEVKKLNTNLSLLGDRDRVYIDGLLDELNQEMGEVQGEDKVDAGNIRKLLHTAARDGQKEVVELLLRKGANVDPADKHGWQALHWAAYNGHKEIIELLLLKGAKVDAVDNDGWRALQTAASHGYKEVVELLLEKGAQVDAVDNDGWRALQSAASKGHKEIVELLLKRGAKVNAASEPDIQALQAAASNGYKEIVELLLQNGASVRAENRYGATLLTIVHITNRDDIVLLLKERGDLIERDC